MASSEDQLKRAADLKLWIESRIAELQEEVDRLKETLAVIDTVLRASSFRPATEFSSSRTTKPEQEMGMAARIPEIRELKRDRGGDTIAVAQITTTNVVIEPVAEIALRAETPPFKSFLLGKILAGMKTKDEEAVGKARLKKGEELRFTFAEKNGRISSFTIENYREKERLSEILNTVAWTFSRMLEK